MRNNTLFLLSIVILEFTLSSIAIGAPQNATNTRITPPPPQNPVSLPEVPRAELPRAMAWSAYNLGTTGYNQAVAIGKVLKNTYGTTRQKRCIATATPYETPGAVFCQRFRNLFRPGRRATVCIAQMGAPALKARLYE